MKKIFLCLSLISFLLMAVMISCNQDDSIVKYLYKFKNSSLVKDKLEGLNAKDNSDNFVDKPVASTPNTGVIDPEPIDYKDNNPVEITEANKYVTQKNVIGKVDGNGVFVEKKDGVIITKFPNGENYYIPDEL